MGVIRMPHIHGYANDFDDLISKIITWSTDAEIHGADAWELIRNDPWPRGTILKAHGFEPGEHFYIGLMPRVIEKGKTYKDWFMQKSVLASNFVWSLNGLKKSGAPFTVSNSSVTTTDTTPNITYSFSDIDIFAASAQVMWMGIFKQYSAELDWHEQPGGMVFKDVPVRPIYYTISGSNTLQAFAPPLYPGAGFPAIGMDYAGPLAGYLEYWITKDAHRMILVTKNREYWDVAYLGYIEPYHNGEYALPAAVIGGTSGAVQNGKDVILSPGASPSVSAGIQFDYRPSNWALVHGLPTFAASPVDSSQALSQVQLMLPDGRWQSFINWSQGETAYPNIVNSVLTGYIHVRDFPVRSGTGHYIRPTDSSTVGTTHVYRTQGDLLTYQLEPLEFVQGTSQAKNLFGRAWRMYWPSSRVAQYGEIIIDDKLHLMLPNAWEGRRFSLSSGRTTSNNPDEIFAQEAAIEAISRQMNCLIRLED
jgi:hypothetical protein